MISQRTKAGLAAAKAKGVILGKTMNAEKTAKANENAAKVTGTITSLRSGGVTFQGIADELNNMGVATPRGEQWTPMAVKNAQART
jgi:DNA invertase Pin-like site-specific DNA recombinase